MFELHSKLSEVYSVNCPVCGAMWSFEIINKNKWIEKRTCGCDAMKKLISDRHSKVFSDKSGHL
jgi:uncharacterized metal-binding protein